MTAWSLLQTAYTTCKGEYPTAPSETVGNVSLRLNPLTAKPFHQFEIGGNVLLAALFAEMNSQGLTFLPELFTSSSALFWSRE